MSSHIRKHDISVDPQVLRFIEDRALPGTGVAPETFWQALSDLVNTFGPRQRALLERRADLQRAIDAWHLARRPQGHDAAAYRAFLEEIGYLVPEGPGFEIATEGTDAEIAQVAGPQLVVPVMNARYALNAANARWGSLYDALYGTDALGDTPRGGGFDAARGARVVAKAKALLDEIAPLAQGGHADVQGYRVEGGALVPALRDPAQFAGWRGDAARPESIVLKNNGLHVVVEIDSAHRIGRDDAAHVADIRLESALTVIMDCEDSVAAVDGDDKVLAWGNWLGLMQGDLEERVTKGTESFIRRLNPDPVFTAPDGGTLALRGRALMLVRNVGLLMTNPAVLDRDGNEAFEGLLDAMVTTLCALHDLRGANGTRNSPAGSIYAVQPKLHGPEEVAFVDAMFTRIEAALGLAPNTVKLGIMDEERRTSVNLAECIRAARHRVAFINTGFLDRTGDEIHTAMEAGAMIPKGEMRHSVWLQAYEDRNVDIGLACGLRGRAQIGKGMWAMPDRMAEMLEVKVNHPLAGANTAWVPSPTAATLHAIHYHRIDVAARQAEIAATVASGGPRADLDALLTLPLAEGRSFSEAEITREVENNAQGILGYVVRWVDQGVGCSKVPNIDNVGLMEDRATCRISAQGLANWLHHGIVTEDQVMAAMRKMAEVVDGQNAGDPAYEPMAPGFEGEAFRAACDLVFRGREQPSGYTEPVLHAWRLQRKARGWGASARRA
ncbi:MAG: malate synthase G [Rhodobacteraceae bacterium]|nr:malate synthase G [Paracoccaceae bacterium]